MRYSRHFGATLHEDPSDAETAGFRLLLRAGCIRPLAAGIFSYLPLGYRIKEKIERILREEMQSIGGEELLYAGGASGGDLEADRALGSDRRRDGPDERPGRTRNGAGDDPRGSRLLAGGFGDPLLPRFTALGVSRPDQMARRSAARGPD